MKILFKSKILTVMIVVYTVLVTIIIGGLLFFKKV